MDAWDTATRPSERSLLPPGLYRITTWAPACVFVSVTVGFCLAAVWSAELDGMSVCMAESGIDPEAEEEPETEEEQLLFLLMGGVEVPLGRTNTSVVFSKLLPFERESTGCVFLAVLVVEIFLDLLVTRIFPGMLRGFF